MKLLSVIILGLCSFLISATEPSIPSGLYEYYVGATYIWLKWDDMGTAHTYKLMSYTDPLDKRFVTGISDPEYQLHGLTPNTDYFLAVAAVDASGQVGQYSPVINIRTRHPAPTMLGSATIDEHTLEVMWQGDPEAESFSILYFTPYGPYPPSEGYDHPYNRIRVDNIPAGSTRAYMHNLFAGTLYVISVVQFIDGRQSEISRANLAVTKAYPPTGLHISSASIPDNVVTIEWDSRGIYRQYLFVVEYVENADWSQPQTALLYDTSFTLHASPQFHTFRVKIMPYGYEVAESDYSEMLSFCPACVRVCGVLPDGDYPSCQGCRMYVTCASGSTYDLRECPDGLVWDNNLKRCEWENTPGTCVAVDGC